MSLSSLVSYTVIRVTQSLPILHLLGLYDGLTRAHERQVGLACSVRELGVLVKSIEAAGGPFAFEFGKIKK